MSFNNIFYKNIIKVFLKFESNIKEYRKMMNGDDGGDGGSEDKYNLIPCQCYGEIEFEDKQTPSSVS